MEACGSLAEVEEPTALLILMMELFGPVWEIQYLMRYMV